MASKESGNMSVTLPKSITDEIDRFVKKYPRYNSRSALIKMILNNWLDEQRKTEMQFEELKEIVSKKALSKTRLK